jgi:hypothetical protein
MSMTKAQKREYKVWLARRRTVRKMGRFVAMSAFAQKHSFYKWCGR